MISTTLPAVVWSVAVVKNSWLAVMPTAAHPSSTGMWARAIRGGPSWRRTSAEQITPATRNRVTENASGFHAPYANFEIA